MEEKVIFENAFVKVIEFNGSYFVDEIVEGEVIASSVGMDLEDVNSYLQDAGYKFVI